jgi:DNA-binding PadR family transcriptional regulator
MPRDENLATAGRLLRELYTSKSPLNKYEIGKRAKIGQQTLYNWVGRMKRWGWIKVVSTGRSRVGLPIEFYRLTKLGQFRASTLNPDLTPAIRSALGPQFEEFQERQRQARLMRFRQEMNIAQQVLTQEKAPPNWFLTMELRADDQGRLKHYFRTGIEPRPN